MVDPTESVKRGIKGGFKVLMIIVALVAAGLIIWLGVTIANSLPDAGTQETQANLPGWLEGFFSVILGTGEYTTWEELTLHLAIFFIILFAFTDILIGFSTFSETASWMIGIGFAIIVGVTKVINMVAVWFGLTAGLGAFGVGIIVLSSIFAVVIMHLGVGGPLRRWRYMRQAEIDALNAERGFGKVTEFIRGAKEAAKAAEEK